MVSLTKYEMPAAMIITTRITKIHTSSGSTYCWATAPLRMKTMSATPVTP